MPVATRAFLCVPQIAPCNVDVHYSTCQTAVGANSNRIQTTGGGESIVEVNGGSRGDVGSQGGDVVGGGRPVESEGIPPLRKNDSQEVPLFIPAITGMAAALEVSGMN